MDRIDETNELTYRGAQIQKSSTEFETILLLVLEKCAISIDIQGCLLKVIQRRLQIRFI